MSNMNKFFTKENRGFSLVETLVAISIFVVSILGLMSILGKGLADTQYAKKKLIASYLAQEGIEYMRNIRDTYVLNDPAGSQSGWDAFKAKVASCTGNGCYFTIDPPAYGSMNTLTPQACGSPCTPLQYYSTTGRYGYGAGGTNSGYSRSIRIVSQPSVNEMEISSTVSWSQGSGNYQIVFSENLFNWVE